MNSKSYDIGVGISLCILSITIFLYAERYVGTGNNLYGPNFFPQVLSVMLFVSSVVLIVRALKGYSMKNLEAINKSGFIRATVTLGIAIAYLFLMQFIGYFIASVIFLFVIMQYLGQKNIWLRLLVSILVASSVYALFHYFLKIPLPEWTL